MAIFCLRQFSTRCKGWLFPLAAFLLLSSVQSAQAFVNIERLRWSGKNSNFSCLIDMGADLKRGNTEVTDFSGGGTIGYRTGKNLFFLVGSGMYGDRAGQRYLNNAMGHLRLNRFLNDKWIFEAYTQIEEDEFRLLLSRTLAGAGMRYIAIGSSSIRYALGLSLFMEHLRYDVPSSLPEYEDDALRLSGYGVINWQFSTIGSIDLLAYMQPRAEDFSDLRSTAEGALRVALSERLMLNVTLNLTYDSDPVGAVEPYDLTLSNTLSLTF